MREKESTLGISHSKKSWLRSSPHLEPPDSRAKFPWNRGDCGREDRGYANAPAMCTCGWFQARPLGLCCGALVVSEIFRCLFLGIFLVFTVGSFFGCYKRFQTGWDAFQGFSFFFWVVGLKVLPRKQWGNWHIATSATNKSWIFKEHLAERGLTAANPKRRLLH